MDDPVLLTGSQGHVGQAILDRLADDHEWRLLDRQPPSGDPPGEFFVGDVTDEETVREAVAGCGAVVHLAGDPRPSAPWDSVLDNNIDGTRTVLEAAVDAGVEKVAFASSNHAVKHYETDRRPDLYRPEDDFKLDGSELPRPGNLYGVSKAAGETLGRYYHDEHDLAFVAVRIGNLTAEHPPEEYERGQAMWLSERDCAHLFERCIEADYDYEIVYGISDNERKYYSIERAKEVLGYEPRDDSAEYE
jgi:NAD+ dependent glucose-6-phosphate dehydrogenase